MKNLVSLDKLVAYENGDMNQDEIIKFFQELVDTGVAWKLQGHYGRVADALIESGMIKLPIREEQSVAKFIKPTVEVGEVDLFCKEVKKDLTSE